MIFDWHRLLLGRWKSCARSNNSTLWKFSAFSGLHLQCLIFYSYRLKINQCVCVEAVWAACGSQWSKSEPRGGPATSQPPSRFRYIPPCKNRNFQDEQILLTRLMRLHILACLPRAQGPRSSRCWEGDAVNGEACKAPARHASRSTALHCIMHSPLPARAVRMDRNEFLLYIANNSTFHVTERRKSGQVADYCCPTCVGRGIYYRTWSRHVKKCKLMFQKTNYLGETAAELGWYCNGAAIVQ